MPAVAPYSGVILEIVARSPMVSAFALRQNPRYAETTRSRRRNSVKANTISVAVMPGWRAPVSFTPTISGKRIMEGRPSITVSASRPPTQLPAHRVHQRAAYGYPCLRKNQGKPRTLSLVSPATFFEADLVHDAVTGGDHTDELNSVLHHSIKWKRSSLRLSNTARFSQTHQDRSRNIPPPVSDQQSTESRKQD